MRLAIDITVEHDAWTSVDDLDGLARRAAESALVESAVPVAVGTELSLVLCDDAFILKLNREWCKKDKPTNVLSFPADPSARRATLGDIVIAYETVAREANDQAKTLGDHMSHLFIHGLLHLLGFDHGSEREAEAMERLEIRALARLGIASPYPETVAVASATWAAAT